MRILIQRVKKADVRVDQKTVGAIDEGLVVLLGIHKEDTLEKIPFLIHKLVHMRLFSDDEGKMNRSLKEKGGELLIVSQFTLYARFLKGNRPSFTESASCDQARDLYLQFVKAAKEEIGEAKVSTGVFQSHMEVALVNDGPVTAFLEK